MTGPIVCLVHRRNRAGSLGDSPETYMGVSLGRPPRRVAGAWIYFLCNHTKGANWLFSTLF